VVERIILLEQMTATGLTIPFTGLRKQYNNLRTEILNAVDEVLRSGQLMNGNHTLEFEHWLAQKNHARYAVTCHSGTHALEIIASYYAGQLDVTDPPRVLIPSVTYVATANAFINAGWEVYFIDVDVHGLLDLNRIPSTLKYDAVLLVGLYGAGVLHYKNSRQWDDWQLQDVAVIEDAAQHWLSSGVVRLGEAAAISFDPMKNLANYGNGGAVVTDNISLANHARSWRDNGKPSNHQVGTNSRMSEVDCATMRVKAQYIDQWQQRRRSIANYWIDRFKKMPIRCLINDTNIQEHCFHKFVVDIDQRDIVKKNLSLRKIETKVHYDYPLHELGAYRQYPGPDLLSSASALCRRVLSLPIYPELTDLEVEYISDQLIDCVS
jgi:dTDP-4-amino-4,6-dideoxygalactose transaminase